MSMVAPCQPWCSPPNPDASGDDDPGVSDAVWCCPTPLTGENMAKAIWSAQVASSVLFRLSGYRFNGVCCAAEYLCVRTMDCGCPGVGCGSDWRSRPVPAGDALTWLNLECGCGESCGCISNGSRIALPYGPVTRVTNVSVNGTDLDPADYVLVDGKWLYFRSLSHQALTQMCFDPFTTPTSGLLVEWEHGQAPPPDGVAAACVLTCELLKSCNNEPCQLPQRLQSITRQGISMAVLDPLDFLTDGLTGIGSVDLFLAGYRVPPTQVVFVEDVEPIRFDQNARHRW